MIGCTTRGYSFTRALLGIAADELHLCGDPAAVPLIQEILKITGDEVEVLKLSEQHLCFCGGWDRGTYIRLVILPSRIFHCGK